MSPELRSRPALVAAAVLLVAVVAAIVLLAEVRLATQIILAVAIVTIPGALWGRALFRRSHRDAAELVLVSLALGLGSLVLGGLVLHLVPTGMTTVGWLAYLVFSVVVAVAVDRRRSAVDGPRASRRAWFPATAGGARLARIAGVRRSDVLLVGMAIAITVLSIGLSRFAADAQPRAGFTELWLVHATTSANDVEVGVRSGELAPTVYTVTLTSGATTVGVWPDLSLAPGATWREGVTLSTPVAPDSPLVATLTRSDATTVYRQAVLRE